MAGTAAQDAEVLRLSNLLAAGPAPRAKRHYYPAMCARCNVCSVHLYITAALVVLPSRIPGPTRRPLIVCSYCTCTPLPPPSCLMPPSRTWQLVPSSTGTYPT